MSKFFLIFFLLVLIFVFPGCQKAKKTDMRSLVSHDAFIFIESNDLSVTLQSLTKNNAFKDLSTAKKDFSFLKNIQLAIAVTGFETSENQVTAENSVLDFKPSFVAIADTHAWQWQTISLVENQINNFIFEKFGTDTEFIQFEKDEGRWFVWTTKDNRKAFAFVDGSRIFFSNNKDSIVNCLSVKNGKAESLKINESLTKAYLIKSPDNLAFGYVSSNGIAQIADYLSIPLAINATESEEGRSFITVILSQILQNTVKEIVWTATESENGITDEFSIAINTGSINILKNTFSTSTKTENNVLQFVPPDIRSVTRYNLQNPLAAWRSLLLVSAQNTNNQNRKILMQFSNDLLNSYAITDAETFLAAIDSNILTLQFDAESENSASIVEIKDSEKIKKSITDQINFDSPARIIGNTKIWESKDQQISAAFVENKLILGNSEGVDKCIEAKNSGRNITQNSFYKEFSKSPATAITFAKDSSSTKNLSAVLANDSEKKPEAVKYYLTETSFTEKDVERKTVSDFGLIGIILEKLIQPD